MKLVIGLVVLAIVAVGAVGLTPDIIRYMKIRSM